MFPVPGSPSRTSAVNVKPTIIDLPISVSSRQHHFRTVLKFLRDPYVHREAAVVSSSSVLATAVISNRIAPHCTAPHRTAPNIYFSVTSRFHPSLRQRLIRFSFPPNFHPRRFSTSISQYYLSSYQTRLPTVLPHSTLPYPPVFVVVVVTILASHSINSLLSVYFS